jgi:hypothetical protein
MVRNLDIIHFLQFFEMYRFGTRICFAYEAYGSEVS